MYVTHGLMSGQIRPQGLYFNNTTFLKGLLLLNTTKDIKVVLSDVLPCHAKRLSSKLTCSC